MVGGVNMRKAQILIKKHEKTLKDRISGGGGVSSPNWGGLYPPHPMDDVYKYHCHRYVS